MKRTSFVLTLLTTLILVSCTATPLPTLVATVSTEELPTPVMTGTPVETLLPTPTLTIPVPTATLTVAPLPSLPVEMPTIISTYTVSFAPGSVIFTQSPKPNASEPGPGLEIINNLFWAIPGGRPDEWSIQPLPVGLVSEIYPSPTGHIIAMRVFEDELTSKIYLYALQNQLLIPVDSSEKFNDLSWLPDQRGIVYADDTNLLVIDTNGFLLEALTDNPSTPIKDEPYNYIAQVEVSPDGQSVALIVIQSIGLSDNRFMEVSTDVMLFDLNQRHFIKLADNVGRNFVNFNWSLNNHSLVFSRENNKGLFVFDVNTLELITLGSEQQFYFSNWSPDGNSLAYTQNTSLFIWDSLTRTEKELLKADYVSEPFWSPDGKYIAIGYRVGEHAGTKVVFPNSPQQYDYQLGFSVDWVRWSPDSKWLIYPNGTALNVLSLEDGSTYLLLPPNEGMTPPNSVIWLPVTTD